MTSEITWTQLHLFPHDFVRIMLLSLFPSVALACLVAARSVSQVARLDDVQPVSCKPLNGTRGTLVLHSLPSAYLQLPDLPLELRDNVLKEDYAHEQQHFIFETCTSTFMNETSSNDDGIYYG
jgi:hypothetical protein